MTRELSYTEALAEAIAEILQQEPRATLFGANFVGAGPARAKMAQIQQRFADRIV
jgi:hypothetical protein